VSPLIAAVPAFIGALLLTGLARRIAVARSVLDVPNERSSHTSPTPSGGGLAIVVVVLSSVAILWLMGVLGRGESCAIL
jgi:glycosyltransferase WbpL